MIFGLFKRKQPSVLDAVVNAIYGDAPPTEKANLEEAIALAHGMLLFEKIEFPKVKQVAGELAAGPIPYSTHDLAVSTAMYFYRKAEGETYARLAEVQMSARMAMIEWIERGSLNKVIAKTFEDSLYTRYKPASAAQPADANSEALKEASAAYFEAAVAQADEIFASTWPWDPAWVGVMSVADQLDSTLGGHAKMDAIRETIVECMISKRGIEYCAAILVALHSANQSELEELMRASSRSKS